MFRSLFAIFAIGRHKKVFARAGSRYPGYDLRLGESEDIVAAEQRLGPRRETRSEEMALGEARLCLRMDLSDAPSCRASHAAGLVPLSAGLSPGISCAPLTRRSVEVRNRASALRGSIVERGVLLGGVAEVDFVVDVFLSGDEHRFGQTLVEARDFDALAVFGILLKVVGDGSEVLDFLVEV